MCACENVDMRKETSIYFCEHQREPREHKMIRLLQVLLSVCVVSARCGAPLWQANNAVISVQIILRKSSRNPGSPSRGDPAPELRIQAENLSPAQDSKHEVLCT